MIRVPTAALALAVAQAPSPQHSPPTFKAESQVIILDVVARDGRGRPVADLRADEIQVFEDGQPCAITSFRLVRGLSVESAVPDSSAGPKTAPEASTAPAQANLVVLLFDRLSVANATAARRGALDLLKQRFPPDTWFAVYKLDRSMRQLQSFTNDPKQLVAAVESATSGDDASRVAGPAAPKVADFAPPLGPPGGIPPQADLPGSPANALGRTGIPRLDVGVEVEVQDLIARVESNDSLYAIGALARGLGEVRGRKTILFLAEDKEIPQSASLIYDIAIATANRANVTVHTVDARGLVSSRIGDRSQFGNVLAGMTASAPNEAPGGESGRMPFESTDGPSGPIMERDAGTANPKQGSFLGHVASDTGGLAIASTNDLGAGLARVVEEIGQYYEVVYEPPRPEPDGRFRRIQAKSTRKGVLLRTRSGYFANAGSPTIAAFELPLLAAADAAQPPHDFAHAATVMHFAPVGREREALFLAEVPLAGVAVAEDAERGTYRAHLALLAFVRDEAGRAVARISQDWPIEGPLAERPRLASTTALFRRAFTLPPGGYSLVTAVQDREANRTSVERRRFDVPPAEGGLALGSLALVRKASGEPASGPDPLRVTGVSIAPHVAGELSFGTMEVPLFLAIYPSLSTSAVELELELRRGGETVARVAPELPAPGPDGRIAWIGSLPAATLPPGWNEIVASVRQGEAVAEERVSFELRSDRRPAAEALADTAVAAPAPLPPGLVPVLEAAGRYVLEYENAFSNIAAGETYTQSTPGRFSRATPARLGKGTGPHSGIEDEQQELGPVLNCSTSGCRRVTKAEVVFARLAGAVPWGCFRDVYEVDGRRLREEDRRLEALFANLPSMSATQRAEALLAQSARYNIGPAIRNINFPTLALAFLHPMNQRRFAWSGGGRRRFGSVEGVELRFDEIARPTIVDRGGQGDLPAAGRFWVDPKRGTVLRSEASFRFERDGRRVSRAFLATEYRPEAKLAVWVPVEMREEYEDLPGASGVFGVRSEGTARYDAFRRFTVVTEEEARVPEDKPQP